MPRLAGILPSLAAGAPSAATGWGSNVAEGSLALAVVVAATAGLISFASPCVLPLLPGFLGYVTGGEGSMQDRSQTRTVAGALLFVAGFSVVFVAGVAAFATVGTALVVHRQLLTRVGGVLVIVMALAFLGFGPQRQLKLPWRPPRGLLGAPVLGVVFGVGWAPCTGPTLGAVLALATATDAASTARGVGLAAAYCLGLGLPFVLIAAGYTRAGRAVTWLRDRQRAVQVGGGLLLMAVGVLLLTGTWDRLTSLLQARLVSQFVTLL